MTESGEEIERLINDVWALQRKLIAENERLLAENDRLRKEIEVLRYGATLSEQPE